MDSTKPPPSGTQTGGPATPNRAGGRRWQTFGPDLFTNPVLYVGVGLLLSLAPPIRSDLGGGFVLCLLIIAYYYLASRTPVGKADPSQVGDNSYLIGFTYTLGVICFSIAWDIDAADKKFDGLLGAMAVALATSIVGMMCRLWSTQGKAEASDSLNLRTRDLYSEVSKLSVSLENAVKATNEYGSQLRAETRGLGNALNAEFTRMAEELSKQLQGRLAEIDFQRVHMELTRAVDAHIGAIGIAARSLDKMREEIEPIAEKIKGSAEMLAAGSLLFKNSVSDIGWEQMCDSLRKLSEQVSGVADAYNHMGASRENLRALVDQLQKDVDEVGKLKDEYRAEFKDASKKALDETHALYARLIGGAQIAIANTENLGKLGDDIRLLAQRIEELRSDVSGK